MRKSSAGPFFIVGSGRSGTTLLRLILAGHSRVTIPPESWFLIPLLERLPLHGPLSPAQVDEAIEAVTSHYRWPDLKIDDAEFARALRALERPTIRAIADHVFETLRARAGKARWGDKTPRYVGILPQIADLYPEARFIHLVRDGHDVVLSMWSRRWWGRWIAWHVDEWRDAIDFMDRARAEIAEERILEIRYEDLVLDTEATVRRACAFVGEQFEPSMLRWEDSVRDKVPEREMHMHERLLRRPRPGDVHRWRRELSAGQVFLVEAHLGTRLRRMGYPTRFDPGRWAVPMAVTRLGCRIVLPVLDVVVRAPGALWRRLRPAR